MVNVFDLFVVVVTVGLAVLGFREGLVKGAINLIGFIVLVIVLTASIGTILEITGKIEFLPHSLTIILSIVLLLVLGMIVIHLVAEVLHKLVHMTPAGFVDSGLGSAFGIFKALLLCGLLAIVLSLARPDSFFRNQYEHSASAAYLIRFMSETVPFAGRMIKPYYHRIVPPPHQDQNNDEKSASPDYI